MKAVERSIGFRRMVLLWEEGVGRRKAQKLASEGMESGTCSVCQVLAWAEW